MDRVRRNLDQGGGPGGTGTGPGTRSGSGASGGRGTGSGGSTGGSGRGGSPTGSDDGTASRGGTGTGRGTGGGGAGDSDAPSAGRGVGLGGGAGGAGRVRGIEFLGYYNQMLSRIRGAWAWPGEGTRLAVKVRFRIAADGRVEDLRLVEPSGDSSYDASVLRAVRAVSPLPPPPARHREDFSDVELTFQPGDLKTP
ncbi:MAG: energy transducer TonB [Alphaproteobacteria bacterium]